MACTTERNSGESDRSAPARSPCSVRSSAVDEDSADASFAGQQDTYLNVVGAESVLDAVQRCLAAAIDCLRRIERELIDYRPGGYR